VRPSHWHRDIPRTSPSQYPRYRRRMNIEKPRRISRSFCPIGHHRNYFILLNWSELGTTSSDTTPLAGGVQSCLCSFAENCSLKLSKRPDHLHHHSSGRRGGIDRLGQAAKASFGLGQAFHDRQDITQRARKPIELPNNEHVSFADLIEEPLEFEPRNSSAVKSRKGNRWRVTVRLYLIGLSSFVLGLSPLGPCSLVDSTLLNDGKLAWPWVSLLTSLKANSA
jgi:hypothetical protein